MPSRFRTIIAFAIILTLMLMACTQKKPAAQSEAAVKGSTHPCHPKASARQYTRDSSFIAYTIRAWSKSKRVYFFNRWGDYAFSDSLKVWVDSIHYDTTKSKLLALALIQYPDAEGFASGYPACLNPFDTRAMIGYLDSTGKGWKLYDPDLYIGAGFCDAHRAMRELEDHHIHEIGQHLIARTIYDETYKAVSVSEPILYTPFECEFWTKSPLWTMGYRIPGYYPFEVNQNAGPVRPKSIKEMPHIDYPQALLAQFE